jgi:protein SCO1/2
MKLRFLCTSVGLLAALLCFSDSVAAQAPARALQSPQPRLEQVTYRGGLVTPPLPKPNFVLTDTSGARFDLRSKTQGHVTLLFFGYTHCPDICPVHMAYLASALKKLPASAAEQFKVVFVTTDPTRDTRKTLRAWLDHFDKSFIGLTGSEAEVEAAQVAAKISPAAKTVSAGGAADFGHAAFVIAYTKDNLGHVIYPSGITQEDWAHDLPLLVTESWTNR